MRAEAENYVPVYHHPTTTICVTVRTRDKLRELEKYPGEPYEYIIRRLIDFWIELHSKEVREKCK